VPIPAGFGRLAISSAPDKPCASCARPCKCSSERTPSRTCSPSRARRLPSWCNTCATEGSVSPPPRRAGSAPIPPCTGHWPESTRASRVNIHDKESGMADNQGPNPPVPRGPPQREATYLESEEEIKQAIEALKAPRKAKLKPGRAPVAVPAEQDATP